MARDVFDPESTRARNRESSAKGILYAATRVAYHALLTKGGATRNRYIRIFLAAAVFLLVISSSRTNAQSGTTNQQGRQITCASDDGNRHMCPTNTNGGVGMVNQRSGSPCIQGQTWGFNRTGIWVDKGCRADFIVGVGLNNGYNGGYGGQAITCSSDSGGRNYCRANTSAGVRLVKQLSGSPCVQGRTWGWDRGGIWVDQGCRADFVTGR